MSLDRIMFRGAGSLLPLLFIFASAALAAPDPGYLTGPASGDPLEIALAYLETHRAELGLSGSDLGDVVVAHRYVSKHNGVTHIYLQQRLNGIDVVNAIFNINVAREGQILNFGNRLVANLVGAANAFEPTLTPEAALLRAAFHLGFFLSDAPQRVETIGGRAAEVRFPPSVISHREIPVRLKYLPLESGALRLVWSLEIEQVNSSDWWNLFVDARTGDVARKFNWTQSDVEGCVDNCYQVFALPKESPLSGGRTIEEDPADASASPFGWHDTDGVAGAEFTDSRGNNVEAQTDLDANNAFGGSDVRASGGASLIFTPALDLTMGPDTYREAAVTNLFYWNNIIHDVTYQYGFDEASGNFQTNNYGNGGLGGDPVQADAQDGSGVNNANFATPADGTDPRMQMFVWLPPFANIVHVNSPSPIEGDYFASGAAFGPAPTGQTGDVIFASDGTGPDVNDGCEAIVEDLTGKIGLVRRGTCNFTVKVKNIQNAGGIAALIQKITPGNASTLGGTDATITIPSGMVRQDDGNLIIANLPLSATFSVNASPPVNRDSDLDNAVIIHEYGHGISNRLVGGPSIVNCLQNNEQMGEGWSDWFATWFTALPGDTPFKSRGMGNYVAYEAIDGPGIRTFPYNVSTAVNPQHYGNVGTATVPHGVGAIWTAMLWDMYWLLVQKDGFDPDLYTVSAHGNKEAMQLVMDGLKLISCSPSFVNGRDAILAADAANFGGANRCLIWKAFAKRGAGCSALAGSSLVVGDEVPAFNLPPCAEQPLEAACPPAQVFVGPGPGGASKVREASGS